MTNLCDANNNGEFCEKTLWISYLPTKIVIINCIINKFVIKKFVISSRDKTRGLSEKLFITSKQKSFHNQDKLISDCRHKW